MAAPKIAPAHYLWLEAAPGTRDGEAQVDIDIRVGDHSPGRQLTNNLRHYEAFTVYREGKKLDVQGHQGRKPAGWVKDDGQAFLTYYRSVPRNIDMDRAAFTDYLESEGLQQALDTYRQQGQPDNVTETFVHHAVLLVEGADGYRISGFPDNALLLLPGTEGLSSSQRYPNSFRLTFAGEPLSGLPVTLHCPDQADASQTTTTSAQGWVAFKRSCDGLSLLRTIYLQASETSGARWQSHWITLTLHQRH